MLKYSAIMGSSNIKVHNIIDMSMVAQSERI